MGVVGSIVRLRIVNPYLVRVSLSILHVPKLNLDLNIGADTGTVLDNSQKSDKMVLSLMGRMGGLLKPTAPAHFMMGGLLKPSAPAHFMGAMRLRYWKYKLGHGLGQHKKWGYGYVRGDNRGRNNGKKR